MQTEWAIRFMYSNAAGLPRNAAKLWDLLTTTAPGDDPVTFFAAINNAIVFVGAKSHTLHNELESEFADAELQTTLKKHRATANGPVMLFNRPAHLIALKLLLGIEHAAGAETALTRIGELTLHINDFVESVEDTWDSDPELLGILAEFAPVWELLNPRNLYQLFVRTYLLLTDHVPAHNGMVKLLSEHLGATPSDFRVDGLRIDDYLALVFGIFTNLRTAVLNQKTCIIDIDQFFRVMTIPAAGLNDFLSRRSGDAVTFYRELKVPVTDADKFGAYVTNGAKVMDATIIKQRPIFRRKDGRYAVLDGRFLIELLSTTLYWTLFDAILDKQARNTFSTYWGECFEAFVARELEFFYPPSAALLRTQVPIDGGEIDAMLDFGDFVVVFEIKSGLLAKDPRLMRDPKVLQAELHKKFVDSTGVWQLVKAARAVSDGKVETTRKGCRIYPILVGDDPVLQCFVANRYLDEQFAAQITNRPATVAPLTVMLIDELEEAMPYFASGDIEWREALDCRFHHDGVSPDSFHTNVAAIRVAKKIPHRKNDFLSQHGQQIGKLIFDRYQFNEPKSQS